MEMIIILPYFAAIGSYEFWLKALFSIYIIKE